MSGTKDEKEHETQDKQDNMLMVDKIELMAQPQKPRSPEIDVRLSAIQKLRDLVLHDVEDTEDQKAVDHDGFEVPTGKIPLDGQFTTDEMKELVEASKEEGVLKDDIDVELTKTTNLCEELVIKEKKENLHA